jgi:hypothetical protein
MEKKSDPVYDDRKVNTFSPPPARPLASELLFPHSGKDKDRPDWKCLKNHLILEGRLKK